MRLQPLQGFSTLLETITPSDAKVERAVPQREVKAQNAQAMDMLKGMLSGVEGAPGAKKKPRKTR